MKKEIADERNILKKKKRKLEDKSGDPTETKYVKTEDGEKVPVQQPGEFFGSFMTADS